MMTRYTVNGEYPDGSEASWTSHDDLKEAIAEAKSLLDPEYGCVKSYIWEQNEDGTPHTEIDPVWMSDGVMTEADYIASDLAYDAYRETGKLR